MHKTSAVQSNTVSREPPSGDGTNSCPQAKASGAHGISKAVLNSSFPNHTCVKQVKSSQLSPGHVNQTTAKLEFLPVATLSFLFCVPPCGDDLLAWGAAFCPGVGLLVLETTCLAEGAFFFSACFLGFFFFCFLTCLPASSGWPGLDTGRQNQIKQKRTMLHSYL